MCEKRGGHKAGDGSNSPTRDLRQYSHHDNDRGHESAQRSEIEPDRQLLPADAVLATRGQLQLQPPSFISNTSVPVPLTVWQGAQFVGHIEPNPQIDLLNMPLPPNSRVAVSLAYARLIITQPHPIPSALQESSNHFAGIHSHVQGVSSPTQDAPNQRKRKASKKSSSTTKKRPKRVARNARPIAAKPASAYAKVVEEPQGMTKGEDDFCLTCIKNNRKCGATQLHMVKGQKRCQNCAFPGKGCSGRICYWPNKARGIATHEDAVRIMAKELGGRTLAKNTRKGRLARQMRSESAVADTDSSGEEETEEELNDDEEADEAGSSGAGNNQEQEGPGMEQETEKEATNVPESDTTDPDMLSAAASAHESLYEMVSRDMGFSEAASLTTMMELAIERTIRDALEGLGTYRSSLEGVPEEALHFMALTVNAAIGHLEQALRE